MRIIRPLSLQLRAAAAAATADGARKETPKSFWCALQVVELVDDGADVVQGACGHVGVGGHDDGGAAPGV